MTGDGKISDDLDPSVAASVGAFLARQAILSELDARLIEATPGRAVIELDGSPRPVGAPSDTFHAAAVAALADAAGGCAALTLAPAGSDARTVDYTINFVGPARGGLLRAVGEVLRTGRSLSVVRVVVSAVSGEAGTTCALLQGSFMRIDPH